MLEGITTVFFDLGATLVDESRVWQARCREQAAMAQAKKKHIKSIALQLEMVKASANLLPPWRTALARDGAPPQAPPELRPGLDQGCALDPWARYRKEVAALERFSGGSAPLDPARAYSALDPSQRDAGPSTAPRRSDTNLTERYQGDNQRHSINLIYLCSRARSCFHQENDFLHNQFR